MQPSESRQARAYFMLGVLLAVLIALPLHTGTRGVASGVDLADHPEIVDDIDGRWLQLAVTDAPRSALDRVLPRRPDPTTSTDMLAGIIPGSDTEQSYVEFERSRLNSDAVARRILGQDISVRGIADSGNRTLTPGEVILDVDGVIVPDSVLIPSWQDDGILPQRELRVRLASPDGFATRQVTVSAADLDLYWSPVAVSALPVRAPLRDTIGGSAGLVNTLAVLDALEPGDLTGGRTIAATGTMSQDGRVRGVQGLPYKIDAALNADVDVLFVPASNLDEVPANLPVPVVGVRTVDDAVRWLCAHDGVSSACSLSDRDWEEILSDPLIDYLAQPVPAK